MAKHLALPPFCNVCASVSTHFDPAFDLNAPEKVVAPVLFNSPHSGRDYPKEFLAASRLDPTTLRRSEDCYVEELFAGVVPMGLPLFQAHFPRAFLDVNREPFELDPAMFDGPLPETANISSQRVTAGLGTIPRIVAEATEIYGERLSFAEAEQRIKHIYMPYHGELYALLRGLRRGFGAALLVDCHSMPSTVRGQIEPRPDFVLGDRYGTSCATGIIDAAHHSLTGLGYSVVRNRPYAGGFITQSYGRPADGFHALQVEINRGLYMCEKTLERRPGLATLADHMRIFASDLVAATGEVFLGLREAAE